jgi:hypothetical protein
MRRPKIEVHFVQALFVGAMAAVGVATVAALEMVGGCEDEVGAFVVEVFRGELCLGSGRDLRGCAGRFGVVWHS